MDTFKDLNGDLIVLSSGPIYFKYFISFHQLSVGEIKTYLATFIINQQAVNAGGVLTQLHLLQVAQVNQIMYSMFLMIIFQAMAMAMVIQPMTQPLP